MAIVKFVHNATLFYTSRGGYRVLCDPWYTPGAFLTWTHVYDVGKAPKYMEDFDALYISHAHEDHFDEAFLQSLPKSVPIILPKEAVIPIMNNKLLALGFERVMICDDGQNMHLGDINFKVYGPYQRSRFDDEGNFPNILDSSIFFDDGDSTFLNTNDNFPTKSALVDFTAEHGKINCISILYNSAGFYPHSVRNLTDEEKTRESDRVIKKCEDLVAGLNLAEHCDYVFPVAGDFCLEGPPTLANKFLPISSPHEFCDRITKLQNIKIVCPGGFGKFDLGTGEILEDGIKYELSDIREHHVEKPTERYCSILKEINTSSSVDAVVLAEKFNSRLAKFKSRLPYNFEVIDDESNQVLFEYKNGSAHEIKIYIEKRIFFALINRNLHWQNAWLGGLMTFWRSDHPHYNKDFYDLLSFLHY